MLRKHRCNKLNFVGGEPLLYPDIDKILKESHECGLTTSIVTNDSLLTCKRIDELAPYLDWVGLSIDSVDENIQAALGRGNGSHVRKLLNIIEYLKKKGKKIKVNAVVTSLNKNEDIRPLIRKIDPDRWKVFQVMQVAGQNDKKVKSLLIRDEEFLEYKLRNTIVLKDGSNTVFETNDEMKDSYIMIDPTGRFFHNSKGKYESLRTDFSSLSCALNHLHFDIDKFIRRGGSYAI
jgi:radical S-adenosyl methionine domain-containing protein 2